MMLGRPERAMTSALKDDGSGETDSCPKSSDHPREWVSLGLNGALWKTERVQYHPTHVRRAVGVIESQVLFSVLHLIGKLGLAPVDFANKLPCVRINQELVCIEPMSVFRLIRSINAVAV